MKLTAVIKKSCCVSHRGCNFQTPNYLSIQILNGKYIDRIRKEKKNHKIPVKTFTPPHNEYRNIVFLNSY